MGSKKRSLPPLPPLGEIVRGRFQGAVTGPYNRWLDGSHLGPYSPRFVPIGALKFMREHPQLSLGLAAYRGPFFGIDYDCSGGTPETRAFVRHAFLETPLLDRVIETILNALDYGFQAHEVLWGLKDVELPADGHELKASVAMPMAAVITEAHDLDPQRVLPVVDDRDQLMGYRVDGSFFDVVPASKALHAVNAMEHRNWRGRSILKRSYKPWWWAEFICLFMSRWYERKSDPPYHGTAPSESRPDPKNPAVQVYPTEVMRAQLLDLRASGVIITPHELDPETKLNKWQIRELTDGGRAGEFVTGLAYLDALMLRGLGVPEEIATRGSVGSQAKTTEVREVFLQELEIAKKTLVLRTINAGIVEPLVKFNFGESSPVPVVNAPEFNREQKALLGELLKLIIDVPQELQDGQEFRPLDMINVKRLVRLLNIPYREPVTKPAGTFPVPQATAPPAAPADPAGEAGANAAGGNSVHASRRTASGKSLRSVAKQAEGSADGEQPIVINNYVQQPPAPDVKVTVEAPPPLVIPAPIVKSVVNVPPQDPPDLVVNIPPQPAPVFNVPPVPAPGVVVNAPPVVINAPGVEAIHEAVKTAVEASRMGAKVIDIQRDKLGRIVSAEVKPEGKE